MSRLPEPAPPALSFQYLAEIAVGATTRVDLSRIVGPHRQGELCAVKRLHPHLAEDPGVSTEFLDEVWMTAALEHPNVVEVRGWGTDAQGSYLAVELVQGVSLARLMKTVTETGEAFPERLVVYIAAQICRGLAAAHGLRSRNGELLNLVHRDLTPGNVLVGFQGEVKITDFGLAKAKMRMTRTLTGTLKGEPTYMAPEQGRGVEIDRRADLFSLGVVMFELFTGQHPWAAPTEFEMVHLIATAPPADLRELRPRIDKGLVALVDRCLEKDPAARYQSAEEILARLEEWLHVHGYQQGSQEALARFVRRNAMRQMRWFERAIAGELAATGEAMPSGKPGTVRPPPPAPLRADTYTGGPITVLGPKGVPLLKGQAGGALDEERTEITADVRAPGRGPVPRGQPGADDYLDDDLPTDRLGSWNEEVPTLVKKGQQAAQAAPQPNGSARDLPRIPFDTMVDEDSDARTTSIKALSLPGGLRVPGPPPVPGGKLLQPADPESEELPTMPIKAEDGRTALPAPGRPPTSPGRSGLPPPPPVPGRSAPPPVPGRSAPPPVPGRSAPPPPLPGLRPLPPPRSPAAPATSAPPPSSHAPEAPASLAAAGQPPQRILSEADRLAREAIRLREEADRLAAAARAVGQAAAIAADAVRILSSTGPAEASRRLEEALALERAAPAAPPASSAAPPSTAAAPPPSSSEPGFPRDLPAPSRAPSSAAAPSSPSPSAPSSAAPPSVPTSAFPAPSFPSPGARSAPPAAPSGAPLPLVASSDPLVPSYLQSRQQPPTPPPPGPVLPHPAHRTGPGGIPQAALTTGDAAAFRSSVQPTLFGMPRLLAVVVGLGVFLVVLGILFLVFS